MVSLPRIAAASLLVLALGAGSLEAQQRGFTVGVSGGAVFPVGDRFEAFETGLQVGGLIETARLGGLPFGVRGEADYLTFSEGDFSSRFISGRVNAVLPFMTAPDARPYFILGAGLYNVDHDIGPSESENRMGVNAGVGISYAIGGMDTFVEGRFHNVFSDGDSFRFIPLTIGIRF
ncbi:MAG: hypothetical protein EA350_12490 [Gemmatimonadales bacterium]|nr:MAG: hypothetical protein EA350_12490 [Gemmatimonadales bacterium]